MSTYSDMLIAQSDALESLFLAQAQGITFDPDGDNRSIMAIVRWPDDAAAGVETARTHQPLVRITVRNDGTTGITTDEFRPGQTVTVPMRAGVTARNASLRQILKHNEKFITFEAD